MSADNMSGQKDICDDTWMIRPCSIYLDEYKECTGTRSRFHQRYIIGHSVDCSQWKKDFEACNAYSNSKSLDDAKAIIESERIRRTARINTVRQNNVWQYRNSPPEDWNKPLPEHLLKNAVPEVTGKLPSELCTIS